MVPFDDIQLDDRLNYVERLMGILDKKTMALHNKVVSLVLSGLRNPRQRCMGTTLSFSQLRSSRTKSNLSRAEL